MAGTLPGETYASLALIPITIVSW